MNKPSVSKTSPATPAIRLSGVSKKIKAKVVLKNITVDFAPACISGIQGPNGSGKTMLLRAIAGLIKLDSGKVEVFGTPVSGTDGFPKSIGFLIEPMKLWDNLSAWENLRLLASIRGLIGKDEIYQVLNRVGLDPHDSRKVKSFSLGMCQRLAIAQAIMEKPELIMLDEPTNALDADGKILVREILIEERKRGATILLVSHDGDELDAVSDYRYVMSDGTIQKR